MEPAFPPIKEEILERLQKQGYERYEIQPISNFKNPHSKSYWGVNLAIFVASLIGRKKAADIRTTRFFWSATAVSIPFFAMLTRSRLDIQTEVYGHRKTLEERLEFNPITRRAWNRALELNNQYQNKLKEEISELEEDLRLKNSI